MFIKLASPSISRKLILFPTNNRPFRRNIFVIPTLLCRPHSPLSSPRKRGSSLYGSPFSWGQRLDPRFRGDDKGERGRTKESEEDEGNGEGDRKGVGGRQNRYKTN